MPRKHLFFRFVSFCSFFSLATSWNHRSGPPARQRTISLQSTAVTSESCTFVSGWSSFLHAWESATTLSQLRCQTPRVSCFGSSTRASKSSAVSSDGSVSCSPFSGDESADDDPWRLLSQTSHSSTCGEVGAFSRVGDLLATGSALKSPDLALPIQQFFVTGQTDESNRCAVNNMKGVSTTTKALTS